MEATGYEMQRLGSKEGNTLPVNMISERKPKRERERAVWCVEVRWDSEIEEDNVGNIDI